MNLTLLHKYLSGECNSRDKEVIENWLYSNAQNREYMESLKQIWEVSPGKKIDVDAHTAWESIRPRKVKKPELLWVGRGKQCQQKTTHPTTTVRRQYRGLLYFFAAAAVIMVAVLFTQYVSMDKLPPQPQLMQQKMQDVVTGRGQRTTLRLPDDTRIHLNVDSRLTIPDDFNSTIREVYLEGEAYFDVASNPDKPFLVHSGNGVMKVLGTEFNVRAYPDENQVQVVVAEGKVSFGSEEQREAQKVHLTRNRQGTLSPNGEVMVSNILDLDEYIGWKTGKLTFKGASLEEVKYRLERWYDIEITLQNELPSQSRRLTAMFEKEPLTEVITVMALALDVNFKREGRKVTIYRDKRGQ